MESDNNLPDIPYTQLQEETSQQQAMEPPPTKHSQALTPGERKARSCNRQSTEKKEQAKEKQCKGMVKKRSEESEEKKE